jgi:gamma-D-glutamyl-L-lysine dipeptidyl-peptidase
MTVKYGIIKVAHAPIRAIDSDSSEIVSQLLFGEGLVVLEQKNQWIRIQCIHDKYEGWMDEKQCFACPEDFYHWWRKTASRRIQEHVLTFHTNEGPFHLYRGSLVPEDYFNGFELDSLQFRALQKDLPLERNQSIIEIAQMYLNTPYLWGGRSATGIDCSGFTQMVFAFIGIQLPRDASQQVEKGEKVAFKEIQAGDLAFFSNANGKVIHVGILTGQGTILHAHGKVLEDHIKEDGIYKKNSGLKSHSLLIIKRI